MKSVCALAILALALTAVSAVPRGSFYAVHLRHNEMQVIDGSDGGVLSGYGGHFDEVIEQKQTILVLDSSGSNVLTWAFIDFFGSLTFVDPETFELSNPQLTLQDHPEDVQWDWIDQRFIGVCMEKPAGNTICAFEPETGKRIDLVEFPYRDGFVVGATYLDVENGLYYIELLSLDDGFYIMVVDIRAEEQVDRWILPNLGTGIRMVSDKSGFRTIGRAPREFVPSIYDDEQFSHCDHGSLVLYADSEVKYESKDMLCTYNGDNEEHPQFLYSIDASTGETVRMAELNLRYPLLHAATMVTVRTGAFKPDVEAYVVATSHWRGDKHSITLIALNTETGEIIHEADWGQVGVRTHFKTLPGF